MLEELEVWEEEDKDEDEEEEEEAAVGLRWDRREPSKDCSDRYGAEEVKKKLIRINQNVSPHRQTTWS